MTLIELDPCLANRPDFGSGLSDRAVALRLKELSDLTLGELAFCLRQSIAIPHVVPLALEVLVQQPLIEADRYPGDLLNSLLHASTVNRLLPGQLAALEAACRSALAGADTVAGNVLPAAKNFLEQIRM